MNCPLFRNPTPPVDYESVVDFEWLAVNTSRVHYLDITGNFTLRTEPEAKRIQFWDWLYEKYVAGKP